MEEPDARYAGGEYPPVLTPARKNLTERSVRSAKAPEFLPAPTLVLFNVRLCRVALPAQRLEIALFIGTALTLGHDVIDESGVRLTSDCSQPPFSFALLTKTGIASQYSLAQSIPHRAVAALVSGSPRRICEGPWLGFLVLLAVTRSITHQRAAPCMTTGLRCGARHDRPNKKPRDREVSRLLCVAGGVLPLLESACYWRISCSSRYFQDFAHSGTGTLALLAARRCAHFSLARANSARNWRCPSITRLMKVL